MTPGIKKDSFNQGAHGSESSLFKTKDDFTEAMFGLFLELGKVGEVGFGSGYSSEV